VAQNTAGGASFVRGNPAEGANEVVVTNAWTHLAVTYDRAQLRIYVNGDLVDSLAATHNMVISNRPLRIGGNAIWGGEYFPGLIDEVRIYNRALSEAEIESDMNAPIGGAGGASLQSALPSEISPPPERSPVETQRNIPAPPEPVGGRTKGGVSAEEE
jgi:hypothetical protein